MQELTDLASAKQIYTAPVNVINIFARGEAQLARRGGKEGRTCCLPLCPAVPLAQVAQQDPAQR